MTTILTVDDNEDFLLLERMALEAEGYSVVTAKSGPEALERLRSGATRPGLILVDVQMPGMNGYQFVERLEAEHPAILHSAQLVYLTAGEVSAEPGVKKICKMTDLDEFVSKIRSVLSERTVEPVHGP